MATPHFDRSALPPPQGFYQTELGKLTRPSRGWARGCCPFHQSKSRVSFSVNLDNGGFYCHGCGAKGGDVLDFVKLRDKVDFKRAAQLLGAWRDISPEQQQAARRLEQDRERQRAEQVAQKQLEHDRRIGARDWLHALEEIQRMVSAELDAAPEQDTLWASLAMLHDAIRKAECTYRELAGIEAA